MLVSEIKDFDVADVLISFRKYFDKYKNDGDEVVITGFHRSEDANVIDIHVFAVAKGKDIDVNVFSNKHKESITAAIYVSKNGKASRFRNYVKAFDTNAKFNYILTKMLFYFIHY